MCGVLMFKRLACKGYLLLSGLDSMLGLMVRIGMSVAHARVYVCMYVCMHACMCLCVCVVMRYSDLLTRANNYLSACGTRLHDWDETVQNDTC